MIGEVIAGHVDGEIYCTDCITEEEIEKAEKEGNGGAVLSGQESDRKVACASCHEIIEGFSLLPEAYAREVNNQVNKVKEAISVLSEALREVSDHNEWKEIVDIENGGYKTAGYEYADEVEEWLNKVSEGIQKKFAGHI